MNIGLALVLHNLGIEWQSLILIVFIISGIVFYAIDFKLGLLVQFFVCGLLYVWFRYAGWSYDKILYMLFITLILLALNLFAVKKESVSGDLLP